MEGFLQVDTFLVMSVYQGHVLGQTEVSTRGRERERERGFFLFPNGRHLCPNLGRMGEKARTELQNGVWTSARKTVTKLIVFMLGISEGMQDVC